MLTKDEIKEIVLSGEGHTLEFKVSLPANLKGVAEEVCAFSNASGGYVLVGVNDKNAITGVTIDNAKRSSLQNILGEISPKLHYEFYIVDVDGKSVAVIDVPSGSNKPYVLSGSIYLRQGPNSQKLTSAEEIRSFYQQSDRIYFDEAPCTEADIQKDIPAAHVDDFKGRANLNPAIPEIQVFQNLKLITPDGYLKNGAALFFAAEPERFFEKAVMRCVQFDGTDKRYISDDKMMTGTLLQQYLKSMDWLKGKLNIRYDIEGAGSGPRIELWEIPETVFKEAIINSLAHRDYYDKGGRITIELFDDRVEIANPGGLVSAIPRSEFGKRSLARNPLIFGLFEKIRMVEHIGSGITRMRDLMHDEGLTPPEFSMDGMFTVTLRRPFDFDKWVDMWVNHLSEKRIAIIKAMHQNPAIRKSALEKLIGLSATAVDNNIDALKDAGLVEREGTKGGNWILHYIKPKVGE
jgi:ATP-dependent DNA helicase RecG